jgi:hypothetical protein
VVNSVEISRSQRLAFVGSLPSIWPSGGKYVNAGMLLNRVQVEVLVTKEVHAKRTILQ